MKALKTILITAGISLFTVTPTVDVFAKSKKAKKESVLPKIPGVSFSAKRAVGITAAKQKIAKKTGIPTTKGGMERKIGSALIGGKVAPAGAAVIGGVGGVVAYEVLNRATDGGVDRAADKAVDKAVELTKDGIEKVKESAEDGTLENTGNKIKSGAGKAINAVKSSADSGILNKVGKAAKSGATKIKDKVKEKTK
jgi:hypothetical protein